MEGLDELRIKREKSDLGGGKAAIERQHSLNKNTSRERIRAIFDEGSFVEKGGLLRENSAGVVTGYGTVGGRLVFVYSQDFTLRGGAIDRYNSRKIWDIMEDALKMGAPLIQIFDSVGAALEEGLESLVSYGGILKRAAKLSGVIPVISLIGGNCTGAQAIAASISDVVILVEENCSLNLNMSEAKTKNYIDSSSVKTVKTALQIKCNVELQALEAVKKLLRHLPDNNLSLPLIAKDKEINIVSKDGDILSLLSDEDSMVELNAHFGKAVTTALISLYGLTTGVLCTSGEALDVEALSKVESFIRLCNNFNISVISILDTPGFSVSGEEEKLGLLSAASRTMYSLIECSAPKISLITGKAYGSAFLTLGSKDTAFDFTVAWPEAKICMGEPENVARAMYRKDIMSSEVPKDKEKELIAEYEKEAVNPFKAAEHGLVDDIISREETREKLFSLLDMLQSKREISYPKKRNNFY